MRLLDCLDQRTGLLPPGRYGASLEELADEFVHAEVFDASRTRRDLWAEWESHRAVIELTAGGVDRIWLAGSFVSAELDPRDIDVTYFIGLGRYNELSRADVADLVEFTEVAWCRSNGMRVDAYLVPLLDGTPYDRMTKGALSAAEEDSLRGIGLYDEVWQRPRRSLGPVSEGRRGYVEVLR